MEATDLSVQMFYLAYVQISLRGVAGRVIRGDTLRMDFQQFAYTATAPIFVGYHGHPFAEQIEAANNKLPNKTGTADFTLQGDLFTR